MAAQGRMEGTVERKQIFLASAIAMASAAGLAGCKDDTAAVKALQDLNAQLAEQVIETNEDLANTAVELQECMKNLAKTKGEAVVVSSVETEVEVPVVEGEATVASLEALKKSLNETLENQKAMLAELETKSEQCAEDLEAAQAEAKAAAEAAAAEAAANKEAAAKKKAAEKKKPTAVRKAEEQGTPTKGVRSRY